MEKKFYVYIHRRKSDGKIFYVGKGCGGRSRNFTHRSEVWIRTYKKHGVDVFIVVDGLPEICALSIEMALIKIIGMKNLCNLSGGGLGVSSITEKTRELKSLAISGRLNPSFDSVVYDFWNDKYGRLSCTKFALRSVYGVPSSHLSRLCSGEKKMVNGWVLYKNKNKPRGKSGPNHSTKDISDTYINEDGRSWVGNPHDFRNKFGLNKTNVYKMRTGRKSPYKGWSLA